MAKIGDKENQARALREARYGSRGIAESRRKTGIASGPVEASTRPVANTVAIEALSPEQGRGIVSGAADKVAALPAGVTTDPREATQSSDAARTAAHRKPEPVPHALASVSGTTTHQYRDPEKRKAYMADYMRKYRGRHAEQRAKEKQ